MAAAAKPALRVNREAVVRVDQNRHNSKARAWHPSPAVARRLLLALLALASVVGLSASAHGADPVGPGSQLTGAGRQLDPVGRLTALGAFPTGGALTPDGRFYWAVDAGRGVNAVRVIDMAGGEVLQTLPIPGGYVGVAFAPDGKRAYVSGEPAEGPQPDDAKGNRRRRDPRL